MADKKVILYAQDSCGPCHVAKAWLSEQGIPFETRDIRKNPQYMDELINMGASATPTLLVGDEMFVGFKQEKIQEAWSSYNGS